MAILSCKLTSCKLDSPPLLHQIYKKNLAQSNLIIVSDVVLSVCVWLDVHPCSSVPSDLDVTLPLSGAYHSPAWPAKLHPTLNRNEVAHCRTCNVHCPRQIKVKVQQIV